MAFCFWKTQGSRQRTQVPGVGWIDQAMQEGGDACGAKIRQGEGDQYGKCKMKMKVNMNPKSACWPELFQETDSILKLKRRNSMKIVSYAAALLVSIALCASPAQALFNNGGFETGDTTGWTIVGDHSVISSFTPQFNNTTGWSSGIPYYGNYSLLLGSGDVGNVWDDCHQSTATQTGTVTAADLLLGDTLYFRWGAVLEEPTNFVFHSDGEQPFFSITISTEWQPNLLCRPSSQPDPALPRLAPMHQGMPAKSGMTPQLPVSAWQLLALATS